MKRLLVGLLIVACTSLPCFAQRTVRVLPESVRPTDYVNQMLSSQGDGTGVTSQNVGSKTITSATNASPNVYTSNTHGYVNGDYLFIAGETGSSTANGLRIVTAKSSNTFQLTDTAGTAINTDGTFAGTVTSYICFVFKPTVNTRIRRLNGYALDDNYAGAKYMNVTALTNGLELKVYAGASASKTLTATPVKTWLHWSLNAGVDMGNQDAGVGTVTATTLRWTFAKAGAGSIWLRPSKDEFLVLIVNDALDGLTEQEMAVQGDIK